MTSRKIKKNKDAGLWTEYGDGCIASIFHADRDENYGGAYYISFHRGRTPAFRTDEYETLEELELAMREVQPDLRKWKTRES